jgi:hypothetical protein
MQSHVLAWPYLFYLSYSHVFSIVRNFSLASFEIRDFLVVLAPNAADHSVASLLVVPLYRAGRAEPLASPLASPRSLRLCFVLVFPSRLHCSLRRCLRGCLSAKLASIQTMTFPPTPAELL